MSFFKSILTLSLARKFIIRWFDSIRIYCSKWIDENEDEKKNKYWGTFLLDKKEKKRKWLYIRFSI